MAKKEVATKPETNVVQMDWQKEMAEQARDIAKTERASTNKISFKSGVMTYMDNAIPDNTLDCIIVAHATERVIYTERYKADSITPPACFALALPGEDQVPHEDVPEPYSDTCATCDMNKWGSDPEGGRGKACKERRRLAVIPKPESLDDIAEADMAMMSIPVTSVRNWANYVNRVSASVNRPPWGVLTRVSLVSDARSQFKVQFELVDALDEGYLPEVHGRIKMAEQILMTPYDMEPKEDDSEEDNKKTKY